MERGIHRYLPKHSKQELPPIGDGKGAAFILVSAQI